MTKRKNRRTFSSPSGHAQQASVFQEPQPKPQPKAHKLIYLAWGALFAIMLCLGVYFHLRAENRVIYSQTHNLQPGTRFVISDPIELKSHQNLQVTVYAPLDNSWAWIGGDFINEESGRMEKFELLVEYYSGRGTRSDKVGRKKWTSGSERNSIYVTSLPAGRYTMQLEFQWEHITSPQPITVTVTQGVARMLHLALALLGISVIPAFLLMIQSGVIQSGGGAAPEPTIQPTSLMLNSIYLIFTFAIVLFYALTAFFGYEYGSS